MSQQIQGSHALSPVEIPAKRKRGRPRKDPTKAESTPAVPAPDSSKKSKVCGASGDEADGMVGQVVTGVIDGTFGAGYLVNVKVGNTDTQLRGLVFLPGRFTPITAENDVAPNARVYTRRAVPFPDLKRKSQPSGSVHSEQNAKQPAELKDQVPKIALAFYSQLSNLQSGISEAPEHRSTAVKIPVADNVPNIDIGLSPNEKVLPPQMEEPKVDKPVEVLQETEAPKLMKGPNEVETNEESKTEPESEPLVDTLLGAEASKLMKGPNEVEATEESKAEPEFEPAADVFPGIETSTLVKGPTDVEANKESKEEPAPMPVVDISQGVEAVVKEPEIHDAALSSDPRNDSTRDEVKTLNLELNQAPVASEPAFENSELVNNSMKKHGNEGVLAEPQLGHAVEVPSGEGKPPVGGSTKITGAVSFSAVKHREEAIRSESKPTSEGRVPPELTELEIRSPSGEIINMECDETDAFQS